MKNKKSKEMLKKIKNLKKNITFIKTGATSYSFCSPYLFIKYVINYEKFDVYKREKYMSTILKKFDWYPTLLYCDDINHFFVFKNVGIPVTLKNKPDNLEKQFNQILADMNSVNVQHNDIKKGEILMDDNNKIYLCDFGWASVNNDLGCGIGIWSCNNKKKPGGWFDDSNTLERCCFIKAPYKDPKRKIGSQSEKPRIKYNGENIRVLGYQDFTINKKTKLIKYNKKNSKFSYINELLYNLNKDNCTTIVDIGCNSGLTSLIALKNGFEHIVSLDHDSEYIDILRTIKQNCNITKINESVFSFGSPITEKFDVVFCGAIIHWIFSLTADFRNFNSIMKYLVPLTNKYLVIEWIHPNDGAIKSFNHIKKRYRKEDEAYTTKNFEIAVKQYTNIISKKNADSSTRTIYVLQKL